MVVLLWILLAIAFFLMGHGILRFLCGKEYRQDSRMGEVIPAGFCVLIGLTQTAHLAAVFLKWPVARAAYLWAGLVILVCAPILIWMLVRRKGAGNHRLTVMESGIPFGVQLLSAAAALSVLLQVIVLMTGEVSFRDSDMTLETVRSFLTQDGVYQVNPLTGMPYENGMPLRYKILCLPSLYAFLSSLTGIDAGELVTRILPCMVLIVSYLAYDSLAGTLFGKDRTARLLMLMMVSVLYWFGDYMPSMDGFLLLHCGYRGVSIRNTILVPFTLSMCLQRKWKAVLPAILAEACIVWTLYGLGACFLVAAVMALLSLGMWYREKRRRRP